MSLGLSYTVPDEATGAVVEIEYEVEIETIPCPFGGERYLFRCPVEKNGIACGRKTAKLYLPFGQRYFGCRSCHNLTYRSCKEHDKRVDALRRSPLELLRALDDPDPRISFVAVKAWLLESARAQRK